MEQNNFIKNDSEQTIVTEDKIMPLIESAIKDRLKNIEEKIDRERTNILTIFGIFASIIAFLSVQVQILQKATSFDQLIALSLILIVGLLCFVLALQWITKMWIENNRKSSLWALVIILVILLLGSFYFGYRSLRDQNETIQHSPINKNQ